MQNKKSVVCRLMLSLFAMPGCEPQDMDDEFDLVQSPVPYDPEIGSFVPEDAEEVPLEDAESEPIAHEFRSFAPNGTTSMTPVGGNGGWSFGTKGLGIIYGFGGRSGARVDQLRIGFYQPVNHPGLHYQAGDTWWIDQIADDDGGQVFSWTACPAGYGAIGFQGRSGSRIDKFGLICASLTNQALSFATAQYGGNGGLVFSRICPSNMWLVGFEGREGDEVDRLVGICADPE